jgi:hypothetical protein
LVSNQVWKCNQPLASYGRLPITVDQTWDNNLAAQADVADGVWLESGCTGDNDPSTIDLILNVRGNGADVGTSDDAVTVKQGAHDIQITGRIDCGAIRNGAHQDGVQINGGTRITFYDLHSGDPSTRKFTCWGAGGLFYPSSTNGYPTDVLCVRCVMVGYNQGLRVDDSLRSGARDSTFMSRIPIAVNRNGDAESPVNDNNAGHIR